MICSNCWINTYNFHLFYGNVKKAQSEFFNDSTAFEGIKGIIDPFIRPIEITNYPIKCEASTEKVDLIQHSNLFPIFKTEVSPVLEGSEDSREIHTIQTSCR